MDLAEYNEGGRRKTRLIAFGHRRRVGKDTATKLVIQHIQGNHRLLAERKDFAGPLKDHAHRLYSWAGLRPAYHYETHPEEKELALPKLGVSPRDIWISLGEAVRKIYPMTWVNLAINSIPEDIDLAIFSDLRHVNEAQEIVNRGGHCIKIVRPGEPVYSDPVDSALEDWNGWFQIIVNDGDISALKSKVNDVVDRILWQELCHADPRRT